MKKLAFRIFISFSFMAAVVATVLLVVNLFGIVFIGMDRAYTKGSSPTRLLMQVENALECTQEGIGLREEVELPEGHWCILLDDAGDIVWSLNQPEDIPLHYSIKDIARITRWYLNDYPVYVRIEEYGLLILGIPKFSVGKYNLDYSMEWFNTLFERIGQIVGLNLILALVLAFVLGIHFYGKLRQLVGGVQDLRDEKEVRLPEKGIFKELARSLNETSGSIQRKNRQLAIRDTARQNWTAGISHDIRTPLAVLMGNAEALEHDESLPEEARQRCAAIVRQSMRVKQMVEDLNLISSLEYDMQSERKKPVKLCPMIRGIVTDMLNGGLSEGFEIELDLRFEGAVVMGDESLLERAVFNIIHNAVSHNPEGCQIHISEYREGDMAVICVRDNGAGVPEEVLANMDKMPRSTHGIGLPLVWRIARVHGGRFVGYNDGGFCGRLELPWR
ncbi:MAG: HAMP domain-containing histidine kinase [Butyrivibrio sp.]|nr:HAMP domain-containing histidine kinase [Muribaculum sp.]MCM1551746.1 HAMP domain-containing histidine kinase [Butyrivibrio sp.]